jgi:hypothetical protein
MELGLNILSFKTVEYRGEFIGRISCASFYYLKSAHFSDLVDVRKIAEKMLRICCAPFGGTDASA